MTAPELSLDRENGKAITLRCGFLRIDLASTELGVTATFIEDGATIAAVTVPHSAEAA